MVSTPGTNRGGGGGNTPNSQEAKKNQPKPHSKKPVGFKGDAKAENGCQTVSRQIRTLLDRIYKRVKHPFGCQHVGASTGPAICTKFISFVFSFVFLLFFLVCTTSFKLTLLWIASPNKFVVNSNRNSSQLLKVLGIQGYHYYYSTRRWGESALASCGGTRIQKYSTCTEQYDTRGTITTR